MITYVSGQIHYQYNDHEWLGRYFITKIMVMKLFGDDWSLVMITMVMTIFITGEACFVWLILISTHGLHNINERHFCDIAYTVLSSLLLVCSVFVCLVFASILGLRRQLITREDWNYPQHCLWLLISVFPLLRCGRTMATCLSSPTSGCSKISIFLLPL